MPAELSNAGVLAAIRSLNSATRHVNTSLEHLSTGKRINRASNDPSGAVAVSQIKPEIASLEAKLKSFDRKESYLGAREGAASVYSDLAIELRGLVVQAANRDGFTVDEREAFQLEAHSILKTFDHLALTSVFNGQQLAGGYQAAQLGRRTVTGTDANGQPTSTTFTLADLASGGKLNLVDEDLTAAASIVEDVASQFAETRGAIGAELKGIDAERNATLEELEGVRSDIEDADFAKVTSQLDRGQVVKEASRVALSLQLEGRRLLIGDLIRTVDKK